jgi:uncharacterized protein YjeT (DUF2065 family)
MNLINMVALRTLAVVRIVNGLLGLFYPSFLIRRLGGDPDVQSLAPYPFRMFGIRTVLIGADLLLLRGEPLSRATRTAVAIHASDTACAAIAGIRREVPRRAAITTTTISAVNTALALVAWRYGRSGRAARLNLHSPATMND